MAFSDTTVGGLGLRSLEMEQELEKIFQLIPLWTTPNPVFSLHRFSLDLIQIEVGFLHQVMSLSYNLYSCLASSS